MLYLPYILPIQLVKVDPAQIAQYLSRHIDDWMLQNRLNRFQDRATYANQWLQADSIYLQFPSNSGQPQVQVIDCNRTAHITQLMIQRQQNTLDPLTYIYESSTALSTLPVGFYWFYVTSGSVVLISEPIEVCDTIDLSLLVQYKHRKNYAGVIWETGIEFNMRIPGILRQKPMASKDVVYEDQVLNMTMIKSTPYRLWELVLGAGSNTPDYIMNTMTWVLGCSSCKIDGRYYSKNDGFKWEQSDEQYNNALYSYRGEIREMLNRDSKIINPPANTNEQVTIIGAVDLKGFADTDFGGSSNIAFIEDVV